jgi:hypothetical protein
VAKGMLLLFSADINMVEKWLRFWASKAEVFFLLWTDLKDKLFFRKSAPFSFVQTPGYKINQVRQVSIAKVSLSTFCSRLTFRIPISQKTGDVIRIRAGSPFGFVCVTLGVTRVSSHSWFHLWGVENIKAPTAHQLTNLKKLHKALSLK